MLRIKKILQTIMTSPINVKKETNQVMIYEIILEVHIDPQWTDWFEGLTVTPKDNGETLITGQIADQAALHGLLKKVRDLGLTLVSVSRVDSSQPRDEDDQE